MRRRSLLATLGTALPLTVAGCTGVRNQTGAARAPRASLRMEPVSDADIARELLWTIENDDGERAALLDEVSNGDTAESQGFDPLVRNDQRVVHEGEVYRVSTTETASTPVTVFSITLNDLAYDTVTEAPDDGRVSFADLPPVDRQAFERAGLADGDLMGIGTTLVYTDPQRRRSMLVPDPAARIIVWGPETEGRFTVDDSFDRTRHSYEYEAEQTGSAADFGESVREEYLIDLSDLSAAERDVLDAATGEEGYTVPPDGTVTEGVAALAERFRPRASPRAAVEPGEGDRGEVTGSYLVAYGGEVYWTVFAYHPRTPADGD